MVEVAQTIQFPFSICFQEARVLKAHLESDSNFE